MVAALPGLTTDALAVAGGVVAGVALASTLGGPPGRWWTRRPLAGATSGRPGLPPGPLKRRLVVETTLWLVLAGLVLAFTSWPIFALVTGILSVAFGAIQAGPARAHVVAEERRESVRYVVARRRAVGTPELGATAA